MPARRESGAAIGGAPDAAEAMGGPRSGDHMSVGRAADEMRGARARGVLEHFQSRLFAQLCEMGNASARPPASGQQQLYLADPSRYLKEDMSQMVVIRRIGHRIPSGT